MRRRIPSTAALIAFESAARHQSFTKAANELNLTQSAICRQIGGLEEFLGIALFRRSRRGVVLTDSGQTYARKIAAQLDAVERDTLALLGSEGSTSLELAVVPTFGTQWLLPRLRDFQQRHPQINVHLTNRTRPFLFADTHFDAAIYYGDADWSGTQAHFLMPEHLAPVCSPALIQHDPLSAVQLAEMPLLQQTTRPYAWRQWFATQQLTTPRDMSGPRLELFSMLAQAACHGMGVALIPPFLIERELREGLLTIAHPQQVTDPARAYYLMVPERRSESAALKTFQTWLLEQAKHYQQYAAPIPEQPM